MKRFWNTATVLQQDGHHIVQLDSRPMRLPGGPLLRLQSATLAEAIAAEWQSAGGANGGTFTAEDVPLTRIAGTAQERIAPDPTPAIDALARYAESDLLCYRATTPHALADLQNAKWQPWLDWAAETYGARLALAQGITYTDQPVPALVALRAALIRHTPFTLAALGILVPAMGSLVLGLALAENQLTPTEAHTLALLDELFQAGHWGEDHEAIHRRKAVGQDIEIAARFMALAR